MVVSFVILSYNRPQETIEAVENIVNFIDHPAEVTIEIIIINNNSSVDYTPLEEYVKDIPPKIIVQYISNDSNLGVAGGRNQGMRLARGTIIFSLDDDAEWREQNLIHHTLSLFDKYTRHKIGILTFKVVEQSDGSVDIATKDKSKLDQTEFFTTYFKGGAHAILKSVYLEIGGYNMQSQYGAEEYELSYKLLDHGYTIVHTSDISILHKRSAFGRNTSLQHKFLLMKNKSLLAYKFLPMRYFYAHVILWSGFFLKNTGLNFPELMKCIASIFKEKKSIKRTVISDKTLNYIRSINGRLTH